MTRILAVGSSNVDLVARVKRPPAPGESLVGRSFRMVCGGKGANQAVAAARLGAATRFIGCVGDDLFGQMQQDALREEGIDIGALKIHGAEPTGTAIILVDDSGQNLITVVPSANLGLTPEDVDNAGSAFEDADVVLVQLEIPLATVSRTLERARKHNVISILDAGPAQPLDRDILSKADVVSPNETEAETITGIKIQSVDDANRAALKLQEMGAVEVVIKLGEGGCFYLGGESLHVPAFHVNAVDTTAAGDAFTAALALMWNDASKTVQQKLRFANAAGALAATVAGAQPSMPANASVRDFLQNQTSVS